jgi:RNase P protein component
MVNNIRGGCNIILIAKPDVPTAPFAELRQQTETLLKRAGVWVSES